MGFFVNDFQKTIWNDNYQDQIETIEETQNRLISKIYADDSKKIQLDAYMSMMDRRLFFGGRVTANTGTGVKNVHSFNCYAAQRAVKPVDSIKNIFTDILNAAEILKTEGGIGFNFNHIRPKGTLIKGVGVGTPGVIAFMEIYDKSAEIITRGTSEDVIQRENAPIKKKIRKGAQISILSIRHPEALEYITAKSIPNKLTKFNMSVAITDEFMTALENEENWDFWFPDIHFEKYDDEWNGDFEEWESKGYPKVIYDTKPAQEIWDVLLDNMYRRNEPGIYFIDNANRFNNILHYQKITGTNPSMPAGIKVMTRGGIFNIEDLENQSFEVKCLDGNFAQAKCFVSGRNQEILEIKFNNNIVTRSTKDHRWPVLDKKTNKINKKYTHELLKGDLIPLNKNELTGICVDESLTESEGFLLGCIQGDGWIHQRSEGLEKGKFTGGITFNINDKMQAERCLNIINNMKNTKSNIKEGKKELTIQFSNQTFIKELINRFGYDITKQNLPSKIWQSNDDFVRGFVDGIFSTDGHISKSNSMNKARIVLTSSKHNFILEMSKLLSFYGIKTTIKNSSTDNINFPNNKEYNQTYYRSDLVISGMQTIRFKNIFEISNEYKNKMLSTYNFKSLTPNKKSHEYQIVREINVLENREDVWDVSVYHNEHVFPSQYCYTGNCGEISMLADGGVFEKDGIVYEFLGDICNLGSLNLCEYVNIELYKNRTIPLPDWSTGLHDEFEWDTFTNDIALLVRGLDNLIDISGYPFEKLKTAAMLRRKIGAGIMGYGSALMLMGMKYGSKEANVFTTKLMSVFANVAYQESSIIAAEKGSFILYDDEVINQGFIKNSGVLYPETIEMIKQNGLRNSQILTVAPNGNLSIYAGCITGGVEPPFELFFDRWVIMNHKSKTILKNLSVPKWDQGEWFETDDFKFTMRGDDQVLISKCGNFMIDRNRGLTQKIEVEEYAYDVIKNNYSEFVISSYKKNGAFTTAMELTADEHLNPFIIFSKHIDNSISKTINLPNDYPKGDFDSLYKKLWREGGRGVTTYREGTMMAVLETKSSSKKEQKNAKKEQKEFYDEWKEHERGDVVPNQVKIPSEYPMKGRKITSEGKKWYVSMSYKDKKMIRPFAIFVSTNSRESEVIAHGTIESLNILADTEGVSSAMIEDNNKKCQGQNNVNKIARTISLLLRHNVKIEKIVKALDSLDLPISSLVYRLKKILMEYIFEMENEIPCPHCGESVVFLEGCIRCSSCQWSKC